MPLIAEELKLLSPHARVEISTQPTAEAILSVAHDADVLMVVYAKITSDVIQGCKNLRGIVRYGIGTDNIDIESASKRGVIVVNVPDYAIETVADHALALLLCLSRRIVIADRITKQREWSSWTSPSGLVRGTDLRGKVLGLIGVGRIGRDCCVQGRILWNEDNCL